jgi:hypothetical protein
MDEVMAELNAEQRHEGGTAQVAGADRHQLVEVEPVASIDNGDDSEGDDRQCPEECSRLSARK